MSEKTLKNQSYNTIAIAGLGLLGGSLAEAIKRHFPKSQILGVSSPASIQQALKAGIIDKGYAYADYKQYLSKADLTILCLPIGKMLETMAFTALPLWAILRT